MFLSFYHEYGFQIMLWIAIIGLIIIFIYNLFSGKRGSYVDHTGFIKKLFNLEVNGGTSHRDVSDKPFESKGELACRKAAENITGKPFPKQRPNFLKNGITNGTLELDCFNEELKIAIEYNGQQHYNYVPYFHKTKDAFYNIKYRDDIKQRLCDANGIKLIVVPYTVELDEIETYLRQYI